MVSDELDDCTPHDLHLEIRGVDCSQDRAHEIGRYAYKVSREEEEDEGGYAWYMLAKAVEDLWGDYEYWHTYDRRGF